MVVLKEINTHSEDYAFVETLMDSAFPADERRDVAGQRYNVDHNEKMRCLLIKDGDVNVGFITVWSLPSGFSYVEHLAIADNMRQCGYGTLSLAALVSMPGVSSVILEVEMPTTDEAKRRISFYEKCGFSLWPRPYIQPAYSSDKQSLPMRIMTLGSGADGAIESAVAEIRGLVYGVRG